MSASQHSLGQSDIPLDLADLLNALAVRRPGDLVLDPSCGQGGELERCAAWLRWLAASPHETARGALCGIEPDAEAAELARLRAPSARIVNQNFLGLSADALGVFDAIVGHPPYARAETAGNLAEDGARQLAIFSWEDRPPKSEKISLPTSKLTSVLSGRSGLFAYFLIHATEFLKEGGRLAFVVPSGWLDVAYGVELKQYLLDHYRIVAIIESAVERWFAEAWINNCVILLEKCSNLPRRLGNLVHLVRLKEPLHSLLAYPAASPQRFVAAERLARRLLPGQATVGDQVDIHVSEQQTLHAEQRWGMTLRTPLVVRQQRDQLKVVPLKMWARVQRGYTTGANEFFYLTPAAIDKWGIEAHFRKPLLKSLRGIDHLKISDEQTRYQVLLIPPGVRLKETAVAEYIRWGEAQGFHLRRTCAGREPWYCFQIQPSAPLVMPKGIWRRHFAPLLATGIAVDQQLYQISVAAHVPILAVAALLNSAWFALQIELHGRVGFGEGLLWLAAYELEEAQLPDPWQLTDAQVAKLEQTFSQLAGRPLADSLEELTLADRQAMDEAVFDILGFSQQQRRDTLGSLADSLFSRMRGAS